MHGENIEERVEELEKLIKHLVKKIESIENILQQLGVLPRNSKPCVYKYYILDVSAKSSGLPKVKAICSLTKKECVEDPGKCNILKKLRFLSEKT